MQKPELTLLTGRVRAVLQNRVHVEPPEDSVDLIESGMLDSMKFIQLLLGLEQDFGIHIDLEQLEVETFRSVATIARFVADRQASAS